MKPTSNDNQAGSIHLFSSPENGVSLNRHISDTVRKAVMEGRLRTDDRLPTEEELAEHLQVHRATVNRSYAALRSEGLLVSERGRGTFIAPKISVEGDSEKARSKPAGARLRRVAFLRDIPAMEGALQMGSGLHGQVLLHDGLLSVLARHDVDVKTVGFNQARQESLSALLRHVDGVVLQGKYVDTLYEAVVFDLLQRQLPVVAMLARPGTPRIPTVTHDREQGTYLATQHLISLGHARIGAVGKGVFLRSQYKFAGYVKAIYEAGLDIQSRDIISSDEAFRYGETYARMERRIREGDLPTAFVVGRDPEAIEAMHALKNAGIRVPEDISITGYNNMAETTQCVPPLTTVDSRFYEMGRLAAEKLVAWIEGGERPDHAVIEPELIVRESTGERGRKLKSERLKAEREDRETLSQALSQALS